MMKVFISWSGNKSREVAAALRDWLPAVINSVEPFVSSKDIDSGTRWQMEVAGQLEATAYGIVCVTRANQAAPWLNFEAGALAKVVESARVAPLAIDLTPSDIKVPLGQFQAQPATHAGIREIVTSLNAACPAPLTDELIERAFEKWWPDLERALAEVESHSSPKSAKAPERSDRELIEEVLSTVRSLAQDRSGPRDEVRQSLSPDHPLVVELKALLQHDRRFKVVSSARGGRVGIMHPRDELSAELKSKIRLIGDDYNMSIVFLPESVGAAGLAKARQSKKRSRTMEMTGNRGAALEPQRAEADSNPGAK